VDPIRLDLPSRIAKRLDQPRGVLFDDPFGRRLLDDAIHHREIERLRVGDVARRTREPRVEQKNADRRRVEGKAAIEQHPAIMP
jgi:hypothetical protein